jgi:hypothetical protein
MISFAQLYILILIPASSGYAAHWHPAHRRSPPRASTFAGDTTAFQYPPAGAIETASDTHFPGIDVVGFEGPTPSSFGSLFLSSFLQLIRPSWHSTRPNFVMPYAAGDEAFAIQTAPAIPAIENESPIVRPETYDHKGSGSGSGWEFDPIRSWGNLSPMFSLPPDTFGLPDASPVIPEGCSIDAVHILHRHGARYPGSAPPAFAAKIHAAATGAGFSASGPLAFLNTWTYKLGAETLTPLGRQQLCVPQPIVLFLSAASYRSDAGMNLA